MKKNLLFVFWLCMVCTMFFTGCGSVATQKQLKQYAKKNFGACKLVETIQKEKSTICTFCDKKYGFEYQVGSQLNSILIDGSFFGETESKWSDYEKHYMSYLVDQVNVTGAVPEGVEAVIGQNGAELTIICTSGDS